MDESIDKSTLNQQEETKIDKDSSSIEEVSSTQGESKPVSNKPIIAGVLLIVAGILGLSTWGLLLFGIQAINTTVIQTLQEQGLNVTVEQISMMLNICATLGIIFSIFPLIGGVTSLQRKRWGFSILGGVLGLFTIGPMFLASILSLVGLILAAVSKQDYK